MTSLLLLCLLLIHMYRLNMISAVYCDSLVTKASVNVRKMKTLSENHQCPRKLHTWSIVAARTGKKLGSYHGVGKLRQLFALLDFPQRTSQY